MKNTEEKEKYHCSGLDYRYIDVDDEDTDGKYSKRILLRIRILEFYLSLSEI